MSAPPNRLRCRTMIFSKWCCGGPVWVDFECDDTCDKLVCFLRASNRKAHHSTQTEWGLNIGVVVVAVVVVVVAVVVVVVAVVVVVVVVAVVVVVVVALIEFHWILVTHALALGLES